MKMETGGFTVERSNRITERKCGIQANSKVFEILSNTIYSDKVTAILRELGANAIDSHVEAGCPTKKFDVHLPNELEPYFNIRDYGVGVSDEKMFDIYMTYFASDKTQSDDKIGGFGLGSKTPLAYTDNFTVTSWYDGYKRIYTVFFDENREPMIARLSETQSDEPRGLKVEFAVKQGSFNEFATKAAAVYSRFSLKPNVTGVYNFQLMERKYALETPEYAILTECKNASVVVMGNIAYPISAYSLGLPPEQVGLLEDPGVEFRVALGAVNMTPSRESLSYTAKTIQTIKTALEHVCADLCKATEDSIKTQPTLWDARLRYAEVIGTNLGRATGIQKKEILWNGAKVKNVINLATTINGETVKRVDAKDFSFSHKGHLKQEETTKILVNKDVLIIANDMERGGLAATRRYMAENYIKNATYLDGNLMASFVKEEQLEKVVKYTSNFPRASRAPRGTGGRTQSAVVVEFDPRKGGKGSEKGYWRETLVPSDGGIYVEARRYRWKCGELLTTGYGLKEGYAEPGDLAHILLQIERLESVQVFGFRDEPPVDDPGWTDLEDHIWEVLDNHKNIRDFITDATASDNIDYYTRECLRYTNQQFDANSEFGKVVTAVSRWDKLDHKVKEKVNAYLWLARKVGITDLDVLVEKGTELARKVNKMYSEAKDHYPLLRHLSGANVQTVADYIRLVDECNSYRAATNHQVRAAV